MKQATYPSKHVIRAYLQQRSRSTKPPPTPEEIRRQLGWKMLECTINHSATRLE